jgi:hypothetical protein
MRLAAFALVALPSIVGCAELRTSYTPPNGEPMRVYDKTVLRTGTQRVATGQDEVRNAQGQLVATNTHYENQAVSWTEREWFPMQGGSRIDDESFYRIVDDTEAVEKYDRYHQSGMRRNSVGGIVLGIGGGVFAASTLLYAIGGPTVDPNTGASSGGGLRTGGYLGMTAGLITAVVGIMMVTSGKHDAHAMDARLFDEPERIKYDAQKYNQRGAAAAAPAPAPAPMPDAAPATAPRGKKPKAVHH